MPPMNPQPRDEYDRPVCSLPTALILGREFAGVESVTIHGTLYMTGDAINRARRRRGLMPIRAMKGTFLDANTVYEIEGGMDSPLFRREVA